MNTKTEYQRNLDFYGKCQTKGCRQPGFNGVLDEDSQELLRFCDLCHRDLCRG